MPPRLARCRNSISSPAPTSSPPSTAASVGDRRSNARPQGKAQANSDIRLTAAAVRRVKPLPICFQANR